MNDDRILLAHGSGGALTSELIQDVFFPHLRNTYLERMEDSAVFEVNGSRLCFTTDSYVINPVFFPGGDIGSLAVHGTINDLAVSGGRPLLLSAGFIIEEGFPLADLRRIAASMAQAARSSGVVIATGDTKVVHRGAADGIFINTAGIGVVEYAAPLSPGQIRPGDAVIVNGPIGDHGTAVLSRREGLQNGLVSDAASLDGLIRDVLEASPCVHCMRDATRGGLGEVLGVCEILGLDPLYIANEGKVVVFCAKGDADVVLQAMRAHARGSQAALIGRVEAAGRPRVVLTTPIGTQREIDLPTGELVPRIC